MLHFSEEEIRQLEEMQREADKWEEEQRATKEELADLRIYTWGRGGATDSSLVAT